MVHRFFDRGEHAIPEGQIDLHGSLVIGVALLLKRKVSIAALFFVMGMILSASYNGMMTFLLKRTDWMIAVRLGVVFVAAIGCTILAWKQIKWKSYDTVRKIALITIGLLINLHSDTLLSFALSGSWAGFIHSLGFILAGLYFLGFLVRFREDEPG